MRVKLQGAPLNAQPNMEYNTLNQYSTNILSHVGIDAT